MLKQSSLVGHSHPHPKDPHPPPQAPPPNQQQQSNFYIWHFLKTFQQ